MRRLFKAFVPALLASAFLASCGGGGGNDVPSTPDGTAKAVFAGVANNQPGIVWAAMPASYQSDVNGLVHSLAGKLDEEVYDKALGLAVKLTAIMKDKKTFILNHPMFQIPPNPQGVTKDKIVDNWDAAVESMEIVLASDISSIATLKTMDVGDFLSNTAADLMKLSTKIQPLPMDLKSAGVELISTKGDNAVIKVTPPTDCTNPDGGDCGGPKEIKMTKVEGKWIPADMAADWANSIADAKAKIDMMNPEMMAQQKPQIMGMLAMIDGPLSQISNASSQEEFNAAIGGIMSLMGGMR